MDELHSGLAKQKNYEEWLGKQEFSEDQAQLRLDIQKQVVQDWQQNRGLGDMENLEEGVKSRDFAEENIHIKMANTTFKERCDYYFQDADYMEAKVLRYRSLSQDDNKTVKEYADKHSNRSLRKRKNAAASAADHFEKAVKLEAELKEKDQSKMSPDELYKARDKIMRERMEGMVKAAKVKGSSKEDEAFRIAKARLSCLTILKDQSHHLRTKDTKRFFDEIEENLEKEIEKERESLGKSTSKVNSKWMDSLGLNDKESLNRELRESGNKHATREDVQICRMFQAMSAERLRDEYVKAQELANENKTFEKKIGDRKETLIAPSYVIRRDKNGKPINKEELKKEKWNKKWLEVCSDPKKSLEKKKMIRESLERFKKIDLPDPIELKKKGVTWFLKKDPVNFYMIYNVVYWDTLRTDEPFVKELFDFDLELKEKFDACFQLSFLFSHELQHKHMIDVSSSGSDTLGFKLFDQEQAEGMLEEDENEEIDRKDAMSKYEQCYPRIKNVEKEVGEKKRSAPSPAMADSYDVTLEKAKKAKNKNFNKDAYKIYQRANSTGDMLHCPAYKHAFEAVSQKLKEDKTLRASTAVDISRRCGAMLRNVKFDKNWEPVSKEDMEAHEWNMKYLTNLRWYRVGPDLSVDDLTAREEHPDAFLQRDEEKKQQAADTLAQMLKEEFDKNFLKDDLLPSPEILKKEMLEPLKNGKPMNCPFIENILGDQKKMDELITMMEKCLSIKETVAILPGGVEFLEAHPEYDKFSNAVGVFTTLMLNSYAYKKYGLIFDASGASATSNFPADAQTLEIYMKNYEDIYKEYRDVKKQ